MRLQTSLDKRFLTTPWLGSPAAAMGPASWRWAAWAQALAGRYTAHLPMWVQLDMTLREAGRAAWTQETTLYNAPLTVNLALNVYTPVARMLLARATSKTVQVSEAAVDAPRIETQGIEKITERWRRVQVPVESEPLVARLTRREHQTNASESEMVTRIQRRYTRSEGMAAEPVEQQASPVPRVLNRQTARALTTTAANKQEVVTERAFDAPTLSYWQGPGASVSPAPIEIGQLTDQVIRAVDERLVLARERMGKR